ncbi:MAG: signal peptide peptidase SppA [Deltaproteobacteria bacterium]
MGEKLKSLLAAAGAVVVIVFLLALVLAWFSGGTTIGGGEKVAVVKIEGVIMDAFETNRQIKEIRERDDIKAVVIRIDTPGGAVGPSQEIYAEIKRLKKTKKVVASMGTIAASGGYYAAVAADRIVANPGTITGSIGVIIEFVNAEELLSKLGLKGYTIKSGRFKDAGSPLRAMEDDEKRLLQGVIDDINSQFIGAVAEGRGKKIDEVALIADGRIFSGAQAKGLGLIDDLGDLTDAIEISARLAGIKGEPEVVYYEKEASGILGVLTGEASTRILSDLFSGLKVMYMVPNPAR